MARLATAYRAANYGSPLRVEPSRRSGRFHRAGDSSPTQYACLHPLGPLAEVIRAQGLSTPDELHELGVRTWALRVDLEGLIDVRYEQAEQLGINPGALVSDDHVACQDFADRQRATGVRGLIVPSAALPGTRNVVLFGEHVHVGYLEEPIEAFEIPASMTGDPAHSPASLLPCVRLVGQPHPEFAQWARGQLHAFDEPDWSFPGH